MSHPDSDLDSDQEAAARCEARHIAVLAGPGSGKTRTLCARAAFLAEKNPTDHLLLMTFANRAAGEVKARALDFAAIDRRRFFAGTYHAFCVGVLRDHGYNFGIPAGFEILDGDEAELLAAEVARTAGTTNAGKIWSSTRRVCAPTPEIIRPFVQAFEDQKREQGVVDFEDLLVFTRRLFDEQPELARVYATRYRHLLIDEFQDTNPLQLAILFHLAEHTETVSIFADDDQAVLSFTGAAAEHVQTAIDRLGAEIFTLQNNYRCREVIAERANALISADPRPSGRLMAPVHGGGTVRCIVSGDEYREAGAVVEELQHLQAAGEDLGDVAILSRFRKRLLVLLGDLREAGLPVADWLGPTQPAAVRRGLRRVLAVVVGLMTDRQAEGLSDLIGVEDQGHREPDAFLGALDEGPVRDALTDVRGAALSGGKASEVVAAAATAMRAFDPDLARGVDEIEAELKYAEGIDPDLSIDHLLTDLALGTHIRAPRNATGVAVAMLQGTKGLEWGRVYLVGMEEDVLPLYSRTTEDEVREERRICFVGVCRARDEVVLTRCRSRSGYTQRPSRFLREMGLDPGA